jgi:outer membrane protein assembly factor BamA
MAKVNRYYGVQLLIVVFTMSCIGLQSRAQFSINVNGVDTTSHQTIATLGLQQQFNSNIAYQKYLQNIVPLLHAKGYIAASIDSMETAPSSTTIWLYTGQRYVWANLAIAEKHQRYLTAASINKEVFNQQPFTFAAYEQVRNKLLDYFENNGYPFATVALDSIQIQNQSIAARLAISTGIQYRIDSIRVFGTAKISKSFLHRYLGIEKNGMYMKEKLANINRLLPELPYLQQTQPWDLTMLSTGSLVNLYLEPKRSNQINVLAGFLPANQQVGGKLLFTVDANLQLKNAFGNGESLGLVWQQIQPKSPRLNLQFQRPYIFNSAFGLDLSFDLFRRDSSFLNIQSRIGVVYQKAARQKTTITLQQASTSITNPDTLTVKLTQKLPDIIDVSTIALNTTYEINTTDYKFNPRKGTELRLSIGAGSRTIKKNTAFTALKGGGFDFRTLYDSITLNSYQFKLQLQAARYFSTGKLAVLKTGIQAGWVESPNMFRNELFQIGGYKLLRGFDEESIFTNRFAVATFEYRLLLPGNSYFFGFSDIGFSQYAVQNLKINRQYIGIGLGLSFETKGGIFNLSYAAGKRDDLPLDMRQSKIHFGYVTVF